MKNFLLAFFLIPCFLSANEEVAKRIYFDGHSYIIFDCKCVIHDPDCLCVYCQKCEFRDLVDKIKHKNPND